MQGFLFFKVAHQLIHRVLPFKEDDAVKNFLEQGLFIVEDVHVAGEDASADDDMQMGIPPTEFAGQSQSRYHLADMNDGEAQEAIFIPIDPG